MRQKIFLLLLFFQCGVVDSFSQNVAIDNLRQNIAYPYIYNSMNIIVEETPCDEIFVSTNNGEMKSKGNCKYVFIPHEVGIAFIFIHKIEKGDTIQIKERKYRVKRWPIPEARLSGNGSGRMGLGEFKAQGGVSVPISDFDISGNHKFDSFRFRIIRDKDLVGEVINKEARYEQKTKDLISRVEKGDRIIFDKIKVLLPGSKEKVELGELIIEIK
jgi:signal peptidase I